MLAEVALRRCLAPCRSAVGLRAANGAGLKPSTSAAAASRGRGIPPKDLEINLEPYKPLCIHFLEALAVPAPPSPPDLEVRKPVLLSCFFSHLGSFHNKDPKSCWT